MAAMVPDCFASDAADHREKIAAALAEMSIEDLAHLTVTSVSRREQKASEAPAALHVITQEDVRRSGLLSIPEALRLAPGMQVARIDANQWAISSRGFNSIYANKLLVLMDGRSVYSPLFAGVHWDVQDTLLEDLDRIEVIRGPGATLWGANAVNGVVNIITKDAKSTQGTLITGGAGSEERGFGGVRYGGKIDDSAYYRVYASYFNRDESLDAAGLDAADAWNIFRSGFRLDWQANPENALTLLGDFYTGESRGLFPTNFLGIAPSRTFETDLDGWNILGRWKHAFSDNSDLELQAYFDSAERLSPEFSSCIDTFDLDGHHRFSVGDRHEVIWGLGYRLIGDHELGGAFATFTPPEASRQIFSAFVQDEVKLVEDRLLLTLGTKLEHNDYTGFELQPGARLLFSPHPRHTFWSSVARAVRTPSRVENDARATIAFIPGVGGPARQFDLIGNPAMRPEELTAYELGYRIQPMPKLSMDLAAFYNVYDHLQTLESRAPSFALNPPPPRLIVPLQFENSMRGETYGAEFAAKWQATDAWRLSAGYAWLKMQLHLDPASFDTTSELAERDSPRHQVHLSSYLDLPHDLQLDMAVYYVDGLVHQRVPGYVRLDVRLGWRPTRNFEASIGAQDLLDDRHPEFGPFQGIGATETQRSVYGKVTWQF